MKTTLSIIAVAAGAMLMALPMNAAETTKPVAKKSAVQAAWPPETLSGKIISVANNMVVVKTSDGIPFDFDLTRHTQIKAGDHSVAIRDLTADVNKDVSVKFIPEGRGDVAESIHISS